MLFEIDAKRWCGELLSYAGVAESSLYHAVQAGTVLGRPRRKPPARSASLTRAPPGGRWCDGPDVQRDGCRRCRAGNLVCSIGTVEAVTVVLDPQVEPHALMELNMPRGMGALAEQFITLVLLWMRAAHCLVVRQVCRCREGAGAADGAERLRHRAGRRPGRSRRVVPAAPVRTGTPWQDADSRGAFVGLTTASDVRSLAHAVIAGVTYELRTKSMASGGGMGINALKVVGGGARSDTWLQLKADVLERRSTAWRLARQGAWVRRCLLATAVGCSTTSRPRRGGTRGRRRCSVRRRASRTTGAVRDLPAALSGAETVARADRTARRGVGTTLGAGECIFGGARHAVPRLHCRRRSRKRGFDPTPARPAINRRATEWRRINPAFRLSPRLVTGPIVRADAHEGAVHAGIGLDVPSDAVRRAPHSRRWSPIQRALSNSAAIIARGFRRKATPARWHGGCRICVPVHSARGRSSRGVMMGAMSRALRSRRGWAEAAGIRRMLLQIAATQAIASVGVMLLIRR